MCRSGGASSATSRIPSSPPRPTWSTSTDINRHGGRFVTVLPASRREDGAFHRYLADHEPTWCEARRCPPKRLGEPDDVDETTEVPWPSAEGFRVIWGAARGPPPPRDPGTARRQHPLPPDHPHQAPDPPRCPRSHHRGRCPLRWLLAARHQREGRRPRRDPRRLQAPAEPRAPASSAEGRPAGRPHVPPRSGPHRGAHDVPLHRASRPRSGRARDPTGDGGTRAEEDPSVPQPRACSSPSAVRLFEIFDGLARRHLIDANGQMIQTFPPELTELERIVLVLLGVPEDRYR